MYKITNVSQLVVGEFYWVGGSSVACVFSLSGDRMFLGCHAQHFIDSMDVIGPIPRPTGNELDMASKTTHTKIIARRSKRRT